MQLYIAIIDSYRKEIVMYGSSYYKLEARRLLKGRYGSALIGTLIFIIPSYLLTLINFIVMNSVHGILSEGIRLIIEFVFTIFVTNILSVGYFRFLLSYEKETPEQPDELFRKHDYNLVVSGYTMNFPNTLRVLFTRQLYMIGWSLVGLVPLFLFAGLIGYMAYTTDIISNLYNMFVQIMTSPTYDMISSFSDYIISECPYMPVIISLTMILTVAAFIPSIMKTYEYMMIPMIMADNPDMDTKHAFARTKDIMTGFKLRYFFIQLSFLLYIVFAGIILLTTQSVLIYYILMLMFTPYMNMTFLRFYRERNSTIEYNISIYGQHEP